MKRFLPAIVCGVCVAYAGAIMLRPVPSPKGFNIAAFGRLPVVMSGRVQPIDTVGRIGLLQIRRTVTVPTDETGGWNWGRSPQMLDATEWLLEVMTSPAADTRRIFPIQDATVLRKLNLKGADEGLNYYTFKDLEPRLTDIQKEAARINKEKTKDRAAWEQEWIRLRAALVIYERLKNTLQPNSFRESDDASRAVPYDFAARLARYQRELKQGVETAIAREHGKEQPLDKAVEESMRAFARPYIGVSRVGMIAMIPPADVAGGRDRWENIGTSIVDSARTGRMPAAVASFAAMSSAFAQGKADLFNTELAKYRQSLQARGLGAEVSRARSEYFYNHFQPYLRATAIYLVACVLMSLALVRRSAMLRRSAMSLVIVAFLLHTSGLLFEMMVEGRLPVTSIYSLIIVAGWMSVLLAAGMHRVTGHGLAMLVAPLAGLMAFIAAHSLAPGGAVELVRETLDGTFWLTIAALAATFYVAGRWNRGSGRAFNSQDAAERARGGFSLARVWRGRVAVESSIAPR